MALDIKLSRTTSGVFYRYSCVYGCRTCTECLGSPGSARVPEYYTLAQPLDLLTKSGVWVAGQQTPS
jgi:hypothetical protein